MVGSRFKIGVHCSTFPILNSALDCGLCSGAAVGGNVHRRAQKMPVIRLQRPQHFVTACSQFVTQCAAAMILTLLICCDVSAQTTGSIVGKAPDPSGAVVPRAVFQATNHATNFSREPTSDASGEYVISLLPGGRSTIPAQSKGSRP